MAEPFHNQASYDQAGELWNQTRNEVDASIDWTDSFDTLKPESQEEYDLQPISIYLIETSGNLKIEQGDSRNSLVLQGRKGHPKLSI